jgi:hypothetical protein
MENGTGKRGRKEGFSFHAYVAEKRLAEEKKKESVSSLEQERDALLKRADRMEKRFEVRMKRETEARARELNDAICSISSGESMRKFEKKVQPYLIANSKKPNDAKRAYQKKSIDKFVECKETSASRTILDEMMCEMGDAVPKVVLENNWTCRKCDEKMIIHHSKAIIACPVCGYMATYMDATSSSMSYTDDVEFAVFSYKRINHFNEWLQQIQAKESVEISQETLQTVMRELFARRIRSSDDITPRVVRDVLRGMKLRKTYDHVAHITARITGKEAARLPPDGEEMCRLMFIAVQPIFDKVCPKDRKNFLSYSYILFKFFQLLGYDQLLDTFSLLKGKDKLQKQVGGTLPFSMCTVPRFSCLFLTRVARTGRHISLHMRGARLGICS